MKRITILLTLMAISLAAYSDDQPLSLGIRYRKLSACAKFYSLLSESTSDSEQKRILNRQSKMYIASAFVQSQEIDSDKHPSWIYILQAQAENDFEKIKQSLESASQDEVGAVIIKYSDSCREVLSSRASKD